MQPLHSTDPQLGPALALVALRAEFPQLPPAAWHMTTSGHLSGTVHDPDVFALYVEVLGGTPMAPVRTVREGVVREGLHLFTTWRDVEIALWASYIVGTIAAVPGVAA